MTKKKKKKKKKKCTKINNISSVKNDEVLFAWRNF